MHENEPSPAHQPEHVTSEQIPHSGVHHDERPVSEFDNTTLPEAVERGLVSPIPDTAAGLESTDSTIPTERKSRKRFVIGGAAFLAGAAVVAGSVMGISALNNAPEKSEHETSAPSDPSESPEAPWSPEVTVKDLEIPAGLSAEATGKLIIERFDAWQNAGTDNKRVLDDFMAYNGPTADFVHSVTDQYAAPYADALYVDGWQSHVDLAKERDFYVDLNTGVLNLNLVTSDPSNGDEEPFQRSLTFDAAREVSSDGGSRVLQIDYTESNNADKNRVGEKFDTEKIGEFGERKGTWTITLVTIDGVEKIAATSSSLR